MNWPNDPKYNEGFGESVADKRWRCNDDTSIEIADIPTENLISLLIQLRNEKKDALHNCQFLLQKNQVDVGTTEPQQYYDKEDRLSHNNSVAMWDYTSEWIPLFEAECFSRGLFFAFNLE